MSGNQNVSMQTKILFDENISRRLVEFVNRESRLAQMSHVSQRGWAGLPDRQWITQATKSGFVIVTGDRNERTRGYTTADLKQLGARVILLGQFWDSLSRWERTKWFVLHIEKLVTVANEMQSGQVCLINKRCRERQM